MAEITQNWSKLRLFQFIQVDPSLIRWLLLNESSGNGFTHSVTVITTEPNQLPNQKKLNPVISRFFETLYPLS